MMRGERGLINRGGTQVCTTANQVRSSSTDDENKKKKKDEMIVAVRQVRLIWFPGR